MVGEEQAQRWLALLVAVLTLMVMLESHRLHKLEFAERQRDRRRGGQPWATAADGSGALVN
jgi:hypothetical protein